MNAQEKKREAEKAKAIADGLKAQEQAIVKEAKAIADNLKAKEQAIADAKKLLGISDEDLSEVRESQERKAFETKKGEIEKSDEIALLIAKVKDFGSPIRIVIESNGAKDVEPTKRVTFPKSISTGTGNGNGSRGLKCKVDGVEYDTMAAACDAHKLAHEAISGKVVLEKAKRDGKIKSFELV